VISQGGERRLDAARLASTEAELVKRLAMAVEYRDDDTGAHIERVSRYAGKLAMLAGQDSAQVELMRHASPLHDVGKVAIPDAVLLKPGKLTEEERAIIETHAHIGWELLRGSGSEVMRAAAVIAHSHHERFDGTGYPQRLTGEAIPIEGRIVAIADVFDALSSDRVYRPAFAPEKVLEIMSGDRGTHFDPDLLDAFLENAR
jgi:putative two-component system response regulator